jgi:hypothetical protein
MVVLRRAHNLAQHRERRRLHTADQRRLVTRGGENRGQVRRVARFDVDRITPTKVAESKLPDFGVIVNSAAAGGPGEKAGLVKGWVIDRYNGKDYWNHHQGMQAQADNNDARREIEAVSPEGERKTFEFGPGRLGINTSNAHRPEQYLLRNIGRGDWDRDMLVTVQAWHAGDHELLETALHRAFSKGMGPNSFSNYYGAVLALDRGDKARAKVLLDKVVGEVGKDGEVPRFYRSGGADAGAWSGRLRAAAQGDRGGEGFRSGDPGGDDPGMGEVGGIGAEGLAGVAGNAEGWCGCVRRSGGSERRMGEVLPAR